MKGTKFSGTAIIDRGVRLGIAQAQRLREEQAERASEENSL